MIGKILLWRYLLENQFALLVKNSGGSALEMMENIVSYEEKNHKRKVVIADVCDTLFYSNTTFDFIRFVVSKQGKGKRILFSMINSKWSPFLYFLEAISRITKTDVNKYLTLLFLKGLSVDEVAKKANLFYDEFLVGRRILPVFDLIEKERALSELVLASSSIDVVVRVIAERNKARFVATPLEINNNLLTGHSLSDLKGKKHLALQSVLTDAETTVVTDNHSDWVLASSATHLFIVVAGKKEESFWENLKPHFIYK